MYSIAIKFYKRYNSCLVNLFKEINGNSVLGFRTYIKSVIKIFAVCYYYYWPAKNDSLERQFTADFLRELLCFLC